MLHFNASNISINQQRHLKAGQTSLGLAVVSELSNAHQASQFWGKALTASRGIFAFRNTCTAALQCGYMQSRWETKFVAVLRQALYACLRTVGCARTTDIIRTLIMRICSSVHIWLLEQKLLTQSPDESMKQLITTSSMCPVMIQNLGISHAANSSDIRSNRALFCLDLS